MRTAGAEVSSAELERKNFRRVRAGRRRERIDYWRTRFAPLVVKAPPPPKPAPAKVKPTALTVPSDLPPVHFVGRYRSRRERAAELRERMAQFSRIYNAGWMVRDAQSTTKERLDKSVMQFFAAFLQEARTCRDYEALLYAVADAITCSRHGVPWEE